MNIPDTLSELTKKQLKGKVKGIENMDFTAHDFLYYDIGMDSLDTMEIVMAAEHIFHVQIDDEDIGYIKTFEDMCNLFENAVK